MCQPIARQSSRSDEDPAEAFAANLGSRDHFVNKISFSP